MWSMTMVRERECEQSCGRIVRAASMGGGGSGFRSVVSFLCVVVVVCAIGGSCGDAFAGEEFSEDLLIRPLSDGKILSHFYFKNRIRSVGAAAHHHLFPKAISQLVRKFHIKEMELSFTQGRWNYERWGARDPIASSNVKPSGVELWAEFGVPSHQVDPTWRNLTHALSGLFCASINFLESPATIAAPDFTFGSLSSSHAGYGQEIPDLPKKVKKVGSGFVRYGALPREAVCTENLTPWLKLLPCRDKAGLTTLLDRPSIYKGHYHSLRVRVRSDEFGVQGATIQSKDGTVLEQTLTLVLQPGQTKEGDFGKKELPHWSLSSIFGQKLEGSCPLAKSSHVFLELEGSLVERVKALDNSRGKAQLPGDRSVKDLGTMKGADGHVDLVENSVFHLSPYPDRIFVEPGTHGDAARSSSLVLDYVLSENSMARTLNLGMLWKERVHWSSLRGPFRVARFLAGSGNQKGSIVIELKKNYNYKLEETQFMHSYMKRSVEEEPIGETSAHSSSMTDGQVVTIFQMVPWYLRLYLHTLTMSLDGDEVPIQEIVTQMRVTPAEDRLSPAVVEIELRIPSNISTLSLNIEFDKGFLHIDEHPPDANRGFDLPSALISFPRSQTQRNYSSPKVTAFDSENPLLQSFQDSGSVHVYSDKLLIPLATPDFSMPYNVITFTCTILALYFGSLLNTLRRRIGEEERRLAERGGKKGGKLRQVIAQFMEGKSETQKKLIKGAGVLIVGLLAVAVQYALNLD